MAGPRPHLDLKPERCDLCGRCLDACDRDALKIGHGYLYVDWERCEGCTACAEACDEGAIRRKGEPPPAPKPVAEPPAVTEGAVTTIRAGAAKATASARHAATAVTVPTQEAVPVPAGAVRWSVLEVVAVLVFGIVLLVAKDAVLGSRAVERLSLQGLVLARAAVQAAYYGLFVGLLALLARRRDVGFREAFGLRRVSWLRSGLWVFAALLGVRFLATMYGSLAQFVGWTPPLRAASDLADWFGPDIFGLALATITIVLVGPFVEEVVFRGMLLTALRGLVNVRLAIVGSALLFAASHLTLWTFVPLALLGTVAGWLAVSRRSVWPAVALHAGYNAVAVFAAFYVAGGAGA